jgi:hypothetical protein
MFRTYNVLVWLTWEDMEGPREHIAMETTEEFRIKKYGTNELLLRWG